MEEQNIEEEIRKKQDELKSLRAQISKKLELTEEKEGMKVGIKKNGQKYSVRDNRMRFFYPKEWFKFFDGLKQSQKMTFKFLINTGARVNEAINVKVGDCDLENKRIILRVTKVKARKGEKNPKPRTIPISSQFAKELRAYIKDNNLVNDNYLNLLSKPATHIALKKTLKEVGINDYYMFSTHNIRKTFECWLMALGIDGLKITSHLGHSIAVASQNYISPDVFSFEEKAQMRMVIGDLYAR